MGRYDYDDMPSSRGGRRGNGSRTTALVALICILLVLIGIVLYLILSTPTPSAAPSEPSATENLTSESVSSQNDEVMAFDAIANMESSVAEEIVVETMEVEPEESEAIEETEETVEIEDMTTLDISLDANNEKIVEMEENTVVEETSEIEEANEGEAAATAEGSAEQEEIHEELPAVEDEIVLPGDAFEETLIPAFAEVVETFDGVDMEQDGPVIPIMEPEIIQAGLLEVLSRMNLDPIPVEVEEVPEVSEEIEMEEAVEKEVPFDLEEPMEVVAEELVAEAEKDVVEEEPAVVEVSVVLDPSILLSNATVSASDYSVVLSGKAGQAIRSFASGEVVFVGKRNGEKTVDVRIEGNEIVSYIGFERVSVKVNAMVAVGDVLGSIGSSSKSPCSITVCVTNEFGEPIKIVL